MKAYKGFYHDMTCRGFQYEEGETYEMDPDDIKICRSGFHACLFPLECLKYYRSASTLNLLPTKYHEVEIEGVIDYDVHVADCDIIGLPKPESDIHGLFIDDSKICGSKITIGRELSILDLLNIEKSLLYNDDEQKKFFDQFKMGEYEEKFKSIVLRCAAINLITFRTEMMTKDERKMVFDEDVERLYSYIEDRIYINTQSISVINCVMHNTFSCI